MNPVGNGSGRGSYFGSVCERQSLKEEAESCSTTEGYYSSCEEGKDLPAIPVPYGSSNQVSGLETEVSSCSTTESYYSDSDSSGKGPSLRGNDSGES